MLFKINIYLKFALIAISLLLGVGLTIAYGWGYGFVFLLAGIILLVSYFLLGTVQSSAEMIQQMDFDGASKRLDLTFFPRLLYVTNRSVYYIMRGSIAAQKKDNKLAEDFFNTALSLKLPTDNEKAMVLLQLSNIHASRGNWSGAKNYFQQVKKLKITEPMIKSQIDQMDTALKNSGQMNLARSMGKQGMQMMSKGGMSSKRRRPPMR